MTEFKKYRRINVAEARLYIFGEDLSKVSVSPEDVEEVSNPKRKGYGMIARNPGNYRDQWYINELYFKENFEEVMEDK